MMRAAVIALAVLAAGCKDKPAPRKQEPASQEPRERQKKPPRPELETPEVSGPGLVPVSRVGATVTFSKTEIKVDDQTIGPVGTDGWIDASHAQALVRALETKANSDAPVAITLDATLPYRHVGRLLDTLKRGGFRNLALLAGSGGQMIPIELPDGKEINGAGLRPVVTLAHQQVKLWSASGLEGTRAKPKLSATADGGNFAPVTRALAEIVQRRWPDGKRDAADKTIIIQPDGNEPAQALLNLLAAVRADGSLELFPNIFLAGGT